MVVARYISRIIFLCLVLVLGAAIWTLYKQTISLNYRPTIPESVGPTKAPSQLTVLPADPVRGASTAPVTLIEFSDFQCSYCAQVAPILGQVVAASQGRVRLVWKDFPLPDHNQALPAAEAAQCAGRQGKFWEYHDKLFERQAELGPGLYQALATEVGLATEPFQQCLAQHELKPFIERNVSEGAAIGVDATPFLVWGDKIYRGTFTSEELTQFLQ